MFGISTKTRTRHTYRNQTIIKYFMCPLFDKYVSSYITSSVRGCNLYMSTCICFTPSYAVTPTEIQWSSLWALLKGFAAVAVEHVRGGSVRCTSYPTFTKSSCGVCVARFCTAKRKTTSTSRQILPDRLHQQAYYFVPRCQTTKNLWFSSPHGLRAGRPQRSGTEIPRSTICRSWLIGQDPAGLAAATQPS